MQKLILFAILVVVGIFVFVLLTGNKNTTPISQDKKQQATEIKSTMKITSTAFNHNTKIPAKYACDGENVNPPLEILDVPANAKSLVLIVDDSDAPSKVWVHWVVYNISPDVTEIEEDGFPEGSIEGMTDFGKPGYGGPCPPSGVHHYFFKLYALHSILNLPQNATKQMVEEKMRGHILDKTELIGLYSRS